jgi:hypothetical protein
MALGTGTLKAISGLSTLAVCGAGAVLVLQDPRPDGAPLTPPRNASTAALVIPPSCDTVHLGTARGGAQISTKGLSPAAQQAIADIRAAKGDKTQIRKILSGLSPTDRQMVIAAIRKANGKNGGISSCSVAGDPGSGGTITGSVGDGGPAAPVVVTGVS